MPNKRKICAEHNNPSQNIYIPTLNSWYPIENVINSAYRKVLDFKENAEKILEKEKLETLSLNEFSKAILDSRSFNISLQQYCIVLRCYITLEKDKDIKKKRPSDQTPPSTPTPLSNYNQQQNPLTPSTPVERLRADSIASSSEFFFDQFNGNLNTPNTPTTQISSGGAKKVNVEVIMRSNPFRVDENEKTTRMELVRSSTDSGMLRFTYYVKPEFEARKIKEMEGLNQQQPEVMENGKLIVFTNDFFTVYQKPRNEIEISLNEIIQSSEEQKRTEALGEKLCILLKDRPRHRALLTNECKLNTHNLQQQLANLSENTGTQQSSTSTQEDETYYTRELINIYGQPIVPSFHKYFNYQLSNTHYGYRTLRRLLNCDILKKFVKITKEEIKSLDRVVEFVQLTIDKCLSAFQINLTAFYDPKRCQNGIVKNWIDIWYVESLKEIYMNEATNINKELLYSTLTSSANGQRSNPTNKDACFLQTSHNEFENIQCDQSNHLWFCLLDYGCRAIEEFLSKLEDYIVIKDNKSELILVHTIHPVFEYKEVLSEARRILSICLSKSITNTSIDEVISLHIPIVARQHVENLLNKYINFDSNKRITSFTALFEILMVLKRELSKEKNDEMKYTHFLCTLERTNQEKLKLAITQLKCVPCLNKFTTNYSLSNSNGQIQQSSTSSNSQASPLLQQSQNNKMNIVSHTNMNRLLKQMSLIVSTELQQIAIDLIEKQEDDKIVKYIRLKDEFKQNNHNNSIHISQSTPAGLATITNKSAIVSSSSTSMFKHQQSNTVFRSKELKELIPFTLPSHTMSPAKSSSTTTTLNLPNSQTIGSLSQYNTQKEQQQQQQQIQQRVKPAQNPIFLAVKHKEHKFDPKSVSSLTTNINEINLYLNRS